MMDVLLQVALGISVGLHGLTGVAIYLSRRRPPKSKKYDITAQDLLHDLTRGGQAILRIEVIDPAAFLLRRP
jgi:hypothetical protein